MGRLILEGNPCKNAPNYLLILLILKTESLLIELLSKGLAIITEQLELNKLFKHLKLKVL